MWYMWVRCMSLEYQACLYPCSLYFVVPTLNFKHAFSLSRSSLPAVKGKEFGCKTIHKGRGEASLLPWMPFMLLTHPKSLFPSLRRCDTKQSPESLWVLRKSGDVCDLINHSQKVIGSCVMIQIFHQSNFRIPDHLESKLINCSNCPKVLKSVFQFTVLLYFESSSKTTLCFVLKLQYWGTSLSEVPQYCSFNTNFELQWNMYWVDTLKECCSVRLILGVRLIQVLIDNVIWAVKCNSNEQWKRLECSHRL